MITTSIEHKIGESQKFVEQRKREIEENTRQDEGLLSKFKRLSFGSSTPKQRDGVSELQRLVTSSAAQVLNQYVFYFSNLHVKFEKAKELLRHFGEAYGVDLEKIYEMELSLKASQPFRRPEEVLYHEQRSEAIKAKHKRRLAKCGDSKVCLCMNLALPYVADPRTLRNLLLLSRKLYFGLKHRIFSRVLMGLGSRLSLPARTQIWLQILGLTNVTLTLKAR